MKIRLENFNYKGHYYEYFECEMNADNMTPEDIYNHIIRLLDRK